ncbi:MAG TPA: transcriptional regulator, partial [Spirochaetota bacterium]|nr:transcriptional regulator [Spirochaetota bacterium]
DIILPPIQLYQLGRVYFVRDGNHRVSVAKRQGREFIDAEVTEIQTDIEINQDMTKEELFEILIEHEKKNFLEMTGLDKHRDVSMLNFSSPGRFDIILSHINGHQYFLGIDKNISVNFDEAMLSWYDNIFIPIIDEIKHENIIIYFMGRTEADLYVWIVKHWDELKNREGQEIKISDAVKSYKNNFGKSPIDSFFKWIFGIFKR